MSKLDDLLKQYCPDGVEYKRLEKVVISCRGKRVTRHELAKGGDYPVFQNSLMPLGYFDEYNVEEGSPFVICAGAAGDIGFCTGKFWAADDCYYFQHLEPVTRRYVYHFLLSKQDYLKGKVRKASVPRLAHEFIDKLEIPVPPLEIQREIVRILDSFTALTAELTAELTARRAQYEYYRDRLLSFEDETAIVKRIKDMLDQTCGGPENVEYKPLSDVVEIKRGKRVTRQDLSGNGNYPVFQNSLIPLGYYEKYNAESNTPYVICAGAAGDIGYSNSKFWAADDCFFFVHPEFVTRRYIYYFLQTKKEYLKSRVRKASVPRLSHEFIKKLEIPVPPLSVQQEIVSILDKFNTLTTDITTGLPAEISLRQKQYEHYRDRLLNFNGGGVHAR